MSTNAAQRLGDAVLARRKELDLTQLEVWQAGGPSNTTLTKIEAGDQESLNRTTARKLDKGLQWHPGSARAVFEGFADPQPAEAAPAAVAAVIAVVQKADLPEPLRQRLLEVLATEGASEAG